MRPIRVEAPVGDVVTLDDLRDHCREIDGEHDAKIAAAGKAAVAYLDGYSGRLGRCILQQKWAFPLGTLGQMVSLPFPDCRDFALEYLDENDAWAVVPNVTFATGFDWVAVDEGGDDQEGQLYLTALSGAVDANGVDDRIKQIIRALTVLWYDTPSTVMKDGKAQAMPHGIETLISSLSNVM
jgi:hypothetical protein